MQQSINQGNSLSSAQLLDNSKIFSINFLPNLFQNQIEELSNGFIIWINGRGLLVDPPVFTSQILTKMKISSCLIEWIIITQTSSKSDQGAFQMMFENSNVELITTRPVSIGAPLTLRTCRLKFFYTLNIIPSLGFVANMENQELYFGGDCFINEKIIFYLGDKLWEAQLTDYLKLEEFKNPQIRNTTVFFSNTQKLYEEIESLGFNTPQKIGYSKDISIYDKKQSSLKSSETEEIKKRTLQKKIDLLSTIEIFENISIKNFRDLLQSAKDEFFNPGEYIIKQGAIGTKFYFVMSGIVCIYDNSKILCRYCPTGGYFGETALKSDNTRRGANVVAVTQCQLLSLEKQDFWFIFGEEKDEAASIIQKLLSMYTARRKNIVNLLKKQFFFFSSLFFFQRNEVFKELNDQQKTELEMIFKETKFETNKLIWTKGEDGKFGIFIKEGAVKFSDCEEQKLSEISEGYFVGEIDSLVNDKPLTTTLISLKPTEVFVVDKQDLVRFFKKNLGILLQLNYLKFFK
ncbi:hypothetical protein IMG5_162900 [Ichthyophthirius multifiliis]|uniref:Cyclic nucleotide-binding domain-containing protein n=1 Tax=Ichthyophthirius multifiliis TaxID=5932 RepID=G0R098_ICHMU|nr:hypothetical protein IMG5_162900 [Ichthyophthirius multifiliis]EGR29106.1 hypothetical protein IMG5_162900 [Ichthyophthirius multifiliis]|eukprot:XP_004030342.1 hypothetical protein IMG5_162900 [Ichthyophthirius multifiliis]